MEKLNEIIQKIAASVQVVLDGTLNLAFQPLFYLLAIIDGIIEVWTVDDDEDEEEYEEPQQVTQLPSTNAGRYADEVELPIGRQRIGFHINQSEQNEIKRIKEQLNNGK